MTASDSLLLGAYFFILTILAVYGSHRYFLVYLHKKYRDHSDPAPVGTLEHLPKVTVQLPVYNEMYVVDRLVQAVCRIDYPRDLLEIQVLDDSTDETQEIARLVVQRCANQGFDISYLHRDNRIGFKAGALEAGMRNASGEFIAIFDADFIPTPDFLQRCLPHFGDPRVAVVQARWGHINEDYSVLTKVQAIMLDGHFILEHGPRFLSGRFWNFNGTAGMWRRRAIIEAGGWEHDTLTEDMDLSYRAQMRGWRFVYLRNLVEPAEVPVEMNAFKSQQHRWAKGATQVCCKILPQILGSNLPLPIKVEAFFHLTGNFTFLLMVALSLLMFPAMIIRYNMGWYEMLLIDVPLFFAATWGVCNFYIVSQREIHGDWVARMKYLPVLMSIGIGLSVNNARAVVEALLDRESEFTRTPKYGIEQQSDEWVSKKYRQSVLLQPLLELALGLYFTATVFYALANGIYGTVPFLVMFQFGFLYTGLMSVVQQYAGGVVADTAVVK